VVLHRPVECTGIRGQNTAWYQIAEGSYCPCHDLPTVETQLFFDLTAKANRVAVHFCESDDLSSIVPTLRATGVAVFEVDGASVRTREDLFKAFAYALKKPKGWYGDEEYAPNADAFLEYLDDVHEWVPANGHVVVVRGAEQFWKANPRLAGMLVEWWEFATGPRNADIHLVFVW
jgi:hypothetical protein